MKKIIIIFSSFVFFILNTAHSQSPQYKSFRDYPLVRNIDTLEIEVRATKNNPQQYLHGLITLELNRRLYSGFFGQDMKTIDSLAQKLRSPLARAMYNYLSGYYLKEGNFGKAASNTLKAIQYFEEKKDTTGMIESYYAILSLNILGNKYKINKTKNSTVYYNRILTLGRQSNVLRDKVRTVISMANLEDMVTGKMYQSNRLFEILDECFKILDQNPNISPLDIYLYRTISRLYSILGDVESPKYLEKAKEYHFKFSELTKKLSNKVNIVDYYNSAISLNNLGFSAEAKKYLIIAINTMEQIQEEYRDNYLYADLYLLLAEIQFEEKDFNTAWASINKSRLLKHAHYLNLKNSFFEELNTQYVLNEKEIENVQLKLANQITELRNQQLVTNEIIGVIFLSIVLVLLFFLIKLNRKQKQLILFRDQLFSIIAHDLRSPMNTYQRYSDIISYLVKTKQFERLETTTQQIDQIGKNLLGLLDNLLNWSLNQQGLIKISPATINAKTFIEELLPVYNVMANLSSLTLINDIEEIEIVIDPDKFALIIRNMLDNAIKYSEENSEIKISTKRCSNDYLLIITNKCKISSIQKKNMLYEFFKSDKDYLIGENKSLGVGAVLVKQYAKIMGANVSFIIDVNGCAIFTFSIPLAS